MKKHLTFAVVAAICASCSNEEFVPKVDEMTGTPVQITAGVNEVTTRADETTTPLAGGSLGLFFSTEGDTDVRYNASNLKVTYNSTWNIEGEPLLWKNATNNVTYHAYYPYADIDEMYLRDNLIPVKVTTDQNQGISNEMDFLYADAVTTTGKDAGNKIDINFDHKMTKLTVSLTKGSELNDEEFAGVSVNTYYGERPFNLSSGTWSEPRSNVSGASISMFKNTADGTFEAIFIPQDKKDFSVTITLANGRGFTYRNPNLTFTPGLAYTLNLIVGADVTALGEVKVSAWPQSVNLLGDTDNNRADFGYSFANNTYTVYNETGLRAVNKILTASNATAEMLASNITLAADITLTAPEEGGSNWTAIGTSNNPYTGTFNGANKMITGLTINATIHSQGLIGYLGANGLVKDLRLVDCQVKSVYGPVGGIVGMNDAGTVTNCYVASDEKGVLIQCIGSSLSVGGIVGENSSIVSRCEVLNSEGGSVVIKGPAHIGGIAGGNTGTIEYCRVTAYDNVDSEYITIESIETPGTGTNLSNVGGIVGCINNTGTPIVSGCKINAVNDALLNVIGWSERVGGIVGTASEYTIINGCEANNISVSGSTEVGGILGKGEATTTESTTLISCFAKNVNVTATNIDDVDFSGILGRNAAQSINFGTKIIACYAYQCTQGTSSDKFDGSTNISNTPYAPATVTDCYFVESGTSTVSGYDSNSPATDWAGALAAMNEEIKNTTLTGVDKYYWSRTQDDPWLTQTEP